MCSLRRPEQPRFGKLQENCSLAAVSGRHIYVGILSEISQMNGTV